MSIEQWDKDHSAFRKMFEKLCDKMINQKSNYFTITSNIWKIVEQTLALTEDELKEKFGAYHVLCGSTPFYGIQEQYDTEDGSIFKIIKQLYYSYEQIA